MNILQKRTKCTLYKMLKLQNFVVASVPSCSKLLLRICFKEILEIVTNVTKLTNVPIVTKM